MGRPSWQIEEDLLRMATVQHIEEPVVVALDTGVVEFAFRVGGAGMSATRTVPAPLTLKPI